MPNGQMDVHGVDDGAEALSGKDREAEGHVAQLPYPGPTGGIKGGTMRMGVASLTYPARKQDQIQVWAPGT